MNEALSENIRIRIKTMDSSEFPLDVQKNLQIAQLKQLIEEQINIPENRQRLIFQGKLLKNTESLSTYKIEDGHVLHLVANLNNASEDPRVEGAQSSSSAQQNSSRSEGPRREMDIFSGLLRTLSESAFQRRNRRLIFQQNARLFLGNVRLDTNESLETIRQNIWSIQHLFNCRNPLPSQIIRSQRTPVQITPFDFSRTVLQPGQWVDVKDTIDQWLEAQVITIQNSQAYIHYNGWGTRWDEWIDVDSSRIAAFRTHTVQSPTSNYLSPSPNFSPDAEHSAFYNESEVPTSNKCFTDIKDVMGQMMILMDKFSNAGGMAPKRRENVVKTECEEEVKEANNEFGFRTASKSSGHSAFVKQEPMEDEIDEERELERTLLSAQLAPMMDRLGRMLTDIAPHMALVGKPHAEPQGRESETSEISASNDPPTARNLNEPGSSLHGLFRETNSQRSSLAGGDSLSEPRTENPVVSFSRNAHQVPVMATPGEISTVANLFDRRLFSQNESNIEFHIHAIVAPVRDRAGQNNEASSTAATQSTQQTTSIPNFGMASSLARDEPDFLNLNLNLNPSSNVQSQSSTVPPVNPLIRPMSQSEGGMPQDIFSIINSANTSSSYQRSQTNTLPSINQRSSQVQHSNTMNSSNFQMNNPFSSNVISPVQNPRSTSSGLSSLTRNSIPRTNINMASSSQSVNTRGSLAQRLAGATGSTEGSVKTTNTSNTGAATGMAATGSGLKMNSPPSNKPITMTSPTRNSIEKKKAVSSGIIKTSGSPGTNSSTGIGSKIATSSNSTSNTTTATRKIFQAKRTTGGPSMITRSSLNRQASNKPEGAGYSLRPRDNNNEGGSSQDVEMKDAEEEEQNFDELD